MPASDDRRFYVLTLRGDLGPFDRSTLLERLHDGSVRPTDQVRNAFGRALGTVAEALELRQARPATASDRQAARTPLPAPRAAPRPQALPGLAIAGGLGLLILAIGLVSWARPAAPVAPTWTPPPPMAPKPALPPTPIATTAPTTVAAPIASAPTTTAAPTATPPTTSPPAPAASTSRLVIVKATWKVPPDGPSRDATKTVAKLVEGNSLSITAKNSHFGDPKRGVGKQLEVIYTWDGETRTKTVRENQTLRISDEGR